MELLEKIFKKKFRILYKDIDVAFEKNSVVKFVDEEEVDDTFYTFGLIPVEYSVMYSLILPASAEENLNDIVLSFVKEKEPASLSLKIDYAFIKDKGKLKVLIGVLKEDDYLKFRNSFYEKSHTLSGILPFHMILLASALRNDIKDGFVAFIQDGFLIGFLMRDGFPVSFLKYKGKLEYSVVIDRFLSSERVNRDEVKILLFGNEFDEFDGEHNFEDLDIVKEFDFLMSLKSLPVVNYLPLKERKVIRRWWRYIVAAIVLIAVLFYSAAFLRGYFKLRNEVNTLKENFEVKKKEAMALRKKIGNINDLKVKVNYIRSIEKNKKKILILFEELTKKIPKTAYVSRVNIDNKGNFDLNGKAKDVYQVVKALNNSRYFKNVEKKSSRESGDYTIFIIRGKVVY